MAFVAGSRHILATLLLLVSASTTAGVAQKSAGDPALLPLPEVKHVKRAGKGYVEGSLISQDEQVVEEWKLIENIAEPKPKPQEHEDLPVSNTVKCVSVLVTMFFGTYGMLFCVQTLKRLGFDFDVEEHSWSHVAQSLFFTPMLCVLFLAARMRAVQLAKGHSPDSFDLPPWWMRWAEIACVACNVVIAIVSYAGASTLGEDWDDAIKRRVAGRSTGWLLLARRVALLVLYTCFPTVCAGALVMSPPPEVWEAGTEPEVSPALTCTIFLTSIYFGVYLCLAIAKNVNESGLVGEPVRFSKSQRAFHSGAATLSFAPMLCCLFITVRMRALQLNPTSGNPEEWVQACFYAASASIGLQSVLSMVAAAIGADKDYADNAVAPVLHMAPDAKTALVEVLRLLLMGGLYTWVAAIIIGLFQMMPNPDSPEAKDLATTPTSVVCVAVLCCLFFGIYLLMWVSSAAEGQDANPVANARDALGFCPMVAVAYMCVTIRSLQLSHGHGAPQDWVQASMIVGTCAIVTLAMSRAASQTTFISHRLCTVLRYASLLALYCSTAMVLYGFYSMQAEDVAGLLDSRRNMHHSQEGKDAMGMDDSMSAG